MSDPFRERAEGLLDVTTFRNWQFQVQQRGDDYFLRVHCPADVDNDTDVPCTWSGRRWLLSRHMTDGEIVQTAFLAAKTAMEHEMREQFKFTGIRVFDPHFSIHALRDFAADAESRIERT